VLIVSRHAQSANAKGALLISTEDQRFADPLGMQVELAHREQSNPITARRIGRGNTLEM